MKRKYGWKGDGTLDGLTRVKMIYKTNATTPYWLVSVKGKEVTGAGSLNPALVYDFHLGIDGTCHLESW